MPQGSPRWRRGGDRASRCAGGPRRRPRTRCEPGPLLAVCAELSACAGPAPTIVDGGRRGRADRYHIGHILVTPELRSSLRRRRAHPYGNDVRAPPGACTIVLSAHFRVRESRGVPLPPGAL